MIDTSNSISMNISNIIHTAIIACNETTSRNRDILFSNSTGYLYRDRTIKYFLGLCKSLEVRPIFRQLKKMTTIMQITRTTRRRGSRQWRVKHAFLTSLYCERLMRISWSGSAGFCWWGPGANTEDGSSLIIIGRADQRTGLINTTFIFGTVLYMYGILNTGAVTTDIYITSTWVDKQKIYNFGGAYWWGPGPWPPWTP